MSAPPTHEPVKLRLTIDSTDQYRWASLAATALVVFAVAMAVFGLPPVDLHSPLHWYGIMDPLCGGTRAARYTAMGRFADAWRYNPLGIFTVLLVGVLVLRGVFGTATGRWPTLRVTWTRRARWIAIGATVVLVALLEIRQQGRAELLMSDTFTFVEPSPF